MTKGPLDLTAQWDLQLEIYVTSVKRRRYLFKLCQTGTFTFTDQSFHCFRPIIKKKTSSFSPFHSPPISTVFLCESVTFVLIGCWLTGAIKAHCCMLQRNKRHSCSDSMGICIHTYKKKEAVSDAASKQSSASILRTCRLFWRRHTDEQARKKTRKTSVLPASFSTCKFVPYTLK
ncbi:hypothetical protein PAMP_022080 [Pampus punctatissimus]